MTSVHCHRSSSGEVIALVHLRPPSRVPNITEGLTCSYNHSRFVFSFSLSVWGHISRNGPNLIAEPSWQILYCVRVEGSGRIKVRDTQFPEDAL